MILDKINSPADLKQLKTEELSLLARHSRSTLPDGGKYSDIRAWNRNWRMTG